MKQDRDASALAARLTSAALTAPPLPSPPAELTVASNSSPVVAPPDPPPPASVEPPRSRQTVSKVSKVSKPQTVPVTLRPAKNLLQRYVVAAADRSRKAGRMISAQEVMLEQLERGP